MSAPEGKNPILILAEEFEALDEFHRILAGILEGRGQVKIISDTAKEGSG